MNIEISIVVPCYNQASFLDEALQSILDQTFLNWECVIVNDGSPDNTEIVVARWLNKDNRFKYIFQENAGLSSARNAGITAAVGKYILPLDADDAISENYLELAYNKLIIDSNLKVVYCKAQYFGDRDEEWILPNFTLNNLAIRNIIFCSAVFRKEDWQRVGGFDSNMIHGLEDWDFWLSILKDGGDVYKLDEICFYYRIKQTSMVKDLDQKKLKAMYDYLSIKHVAFFVEQLGSFKYLISQNSKLESRLNSEKFLVNTLTEKFFGIKIFNLINS